jgi:tetratricopeptide (TPR) repeat protein
MLPPAVICQAEMQRPVTKVPESIVPEPVGEDGKLVELPSIPVLDDYPGRTLAENLDHQLARAVFMVELAEHMDLEALFKSIGIDSGIQGIVEAAAGSLDEAARELGLSSRADIFRPDSPLDESAPISDEAVTRVFEFIAAKVEPERNDIVKLRLRKYVQSLGIEWPWVEAELGLAFDVVYLEGLLTGVPRGIMITGRLQPPHMTERLETELKIDVGEAVPDAISRLQAYEAEIRDARKRLASNTTPLPRGRVRAKTQETLAEDVRRYFRNRILRESIASIARRDYPEAQDRRKDVRTSIRRAERALSLTSFRYTENGEEVDLVNPDSGWVKGPEPSLEARRIEAASIRAWNDPAALFEINAMFVREQLFERSLELGQRILELAPQFLEARVQRGIALFALGRQEEARTELDACLAEDSTNLPALHMVGAVYRDLGLYREALGYLDHEIALHKRELDRSEPRSDPFLSHALLDRASVLERLGEVERAGEDLDLACAIDPENPHVWNARGGHFHTVGEIERAVPDLRRAIELEPNNPAFWNDLGTVLTGTEPAAAEEILDKAIALDTTYSPAHVNKGIIYIGKGMRDEAIAEWQIALAKDATNPYPNMNIAAALAGDSARLEEALANARRALAIAPKLAQAHAVYGAVLGASHRTPEAASEFRTAMELGDKSEQTITYLAQAETESLDLDAALSTITLLLSHYPDSAAKLRTEKWLEPLRSSPRHRRILNLLVVR